MPTHSLTTDPELLEAMRSVVPQTDPAYWECDCCEGFVHAKSDRLYCPNCRAHQGTQANARCIDVKYPTTHFQA